VTTLTNIITTYETSANFDDEVLKLKDELHIGVGSAALRDFALICKGS
jgi:hypothetical protein